MSPHAHSLLLDFAFVFAIFATFFNYGYAGGPGPWHNRIYFHAGWFAFALFLASFIF